MVEAIADANLPLPEPPAHVRLRDGDRVFWEGIICARARGEWLPNDLVIAVQLARCQADIERESLALEGEGAVVTNDRGTLVANARFSVMGQLVRLETELMRNLRICGSASGNAREDASRRRMQMRGATLVGELADDELLAI